MASQVLSGATNASYTNNTGQNVRLIINYMSNVTSMTWAGVTVTASSTTIGKDIQNITGEFRQAVPGAEPPRGFLRPDVFPSGGYDANLAEVSNKKAVIYRRNASRIDSRTFADVVPTIWAATDDSTNSWVRQTINLVAGSSSLIEQNDPQYQNNLYYVPLTVSRGGNFPVEIMLSNGESFSSVCGAYNAIVIKEDGT